MVLLIVPRPRASPAAMPDPPRLRRKHRKREEERDPKSAIEDICDRGCNWLTPRAGDQRHRIWGDDVCRVDDQRQELISLSYELSTKR